MNWLCHHGGLTVLTASIKQHCTLYNEQDVGTIHVHVHAFTFKLLAFVNSFAVVNHCLIIYQVE